jgi:hypothetical protein
MMGHPLVGVSVIARDVGDTVTIWANEANKGPFRFSMAGNAIIVPHRTARPQNTG